ncbi:MAG: CPBP family intramembrane metalloprotease [Erythrobacter sp.]|uniref:CPBP family intramembrane glutamic endopeptidase n=1 Tax=Erythrobacter sp. TaxID=1042 RepID=UPI0025D9D868|nr:type II CAAX endopeptidase family protein [Erythrobacter sp.]MCM0000246.1 CPBP family intramembrane metalloprotease [Erythrobacter sp.]
MDTENAAPQPLWKRIWNFPLVAMLVALAVTAAVIAIVSIGFGAIAEALGESLPSEVTAPLQVILVVAALIGLQKLVLRRLGERKHDDLPFVGAAQALAVGILAAFVLFSLIVGIAALLGAYRIVGWGGLSNWIFLLFAAGVNAGFVEELIFRGILFRWIEEFGGSWAALVVTSGLFGLVHIGNENATWFSSFAIAVEAGVMLGGAYMLTRSLWAPVGLHFGWNVTQGLVWDVPVSGNDVDGVVDARLVGDPLISGGAFGLEASIIALVVASGFGVWLVKRAANKGEVMAPWWVRRKAAAAASA